MSKQQPPPSPRLTGVIVKMMPEKGFGFIRGDDGKEYFVHRSAVREWDHLQPQQAVSFTVVMAPKGPRAEDVELES